MEIRKFFKKNTEAAFLLAVVLAVFGSWAAGDPPAARRDVPQATSAAIDSTMQVVIIKGKRMSAAEKAATA